MTLTTIHAAPSLTEDFTSLEDHQSQTPSSFFHAKPVLHFHSPSPMTAIIPRDQRARLPLPGPSTAEAPSADADPVAMIEAVDIFVTSQNLTLFSVATSTGLAIPYPNISLHAISAFPGNATLAPVPKALYMQLDLSGPDDADDDDDDDAARTVELTVLPTASSVAAGEEEVAALFAAISTCSNLHPDTGARDGDGDGAAQGESRIRFEGSVGYEGVGGGVFFRDEVDGGHNGAATAAGLPPPFPGSGGWITAENVGEFFDGEGNWIGGGGGHGDGDGGGEVDEGVERRAGLGGGAGRVRARDEMEGDAAGQVVVETTRLNGHADAQEESKWRRTE